MARQRWTGVHIYTSPPSTVVDLPVLQGTLRCPCMVTLVYRLMELAYVNERCKDAVEQPAGVAVPLIKTDGPGWYAQARGTSQPAIISFRRHEQHHILAT